ncbi:hypothetical protein QYF36_025323 [Acer negundo]|nr:hypothetical protein QYF36_025323 [Acer negundo]
MEMYIDDLITKSLAKDQHPVIEVNPEKIKVILDRESPTTLKKAQRLTGRIVALNRFISQSIDKCHPFFKIIKQVSKTATSRALMKECSDGVQMPVYYVSRALTKSEKNYTFLEKLAYVLVTAARKLRLYFQVHTIAVVTNQLLSMISNQETTPNAVLDPTLESHKWPNDRKVWTLYTDGASNQLGCGAKVILTDPEGIECSHCFRFEFRATNNEAEYKALLVGMKAKGDSMITYLKQVKKAMTRFKDVRMKQIPRENNHRADVLAKIAAIGGKTLPRGVPLHLIPRPSIARGVEVNPVDRLLCWMDPIAGYL